MYKITVHVMYIGDNRINIRSSCLVIDHIVSYTCTLILFLFTDHYINFVQFKIVLHK